MMNRQTPVAAALLFCFLCTTSQAQLTFDANSENATGFINNVGFTTSWNTVASNKNWVDSVPNNVAFTNTSSVIFGSALPTAGTGSTTVDVTASVSVTNMTIANVAGLSHTFTGQRITGSSTLLIDSNTNLLTTTFDNGTGGSNQFANLTLKQGSVAGSAGISVSNNISLENGNVSTVLSGAGIATKSTGGTVTLFGANTYTGGTNVNAGMLALGASNALADAGAVNVGGGDFSIGSNSDTVGAVTLASGSISGTTGVLTGSSYAVLSGTISARLGGAGGLTKTTAGTVTLSGANSYSGGTNVNAGTLNANSNGALGGGNVLISSGATLNLGANNVINDSASVTLAGTLNVSNFTDTISSLTLSGGGNITGTGTLTGSIFDLQSGNVTANLVGGSVAIANGATLDSDLTVGAGKTLSGAGTIDGNLVFSAGSFLAVDSTISTTLDLSKIIKVTGLTSSLSFTDFTLANLTGVNWALKDAGTYTLISGGAGGVSLLGNSSTFANQYDLGGGKFGYFQAGSLDLIITAVPEPSSMVLVVFGVVGLAIRRRNRP